MTEIRRALPRLLRLRQIEEEESRQALEIAAAERNRAECEFARTVEHYAQSRRQFTAGVLRQNSLDRTGALLEMEQADRDRLVALPALHAANSKEARLKTGFLARRTERRQVEALVETQQRKGNAEDMRRVQQMLDDWYGRRNAERKPGAVKTAK